MKIITHILMGHVDPHANENGAIITGNMAAGRKWNEGLLEPTIIPDPVYGYGFDVEYDDGE